MEKNNYWEKCHEAFHLMEEHSKMLVYTGFRKDGLPVFKVVYCMTPCAVKIGTNGKAYSRLVAIASSTSTAMRYNYHHCVSLQHRALFTTFIDTTFDWMNRDDSIQALPPSYAATTLTQPAPPYPLHS